jgi:hypothetical protein
MENHQYSLAKPAQISQIAESGKTTLSLIKKRQTILFAAFSYLIVEKLGILRQVRTGSGSDRVKSAKPGRYRSRF